MMFVVVTLYQEKLYMTLYCSGLGLYSHHRSLYREV
jgi:hypothetical protein